jgi:hypothetical protein
MPNWSIRAYHSKTVEDMFPAGAPLLPGHTSLAQDRPVIMAGTFTLDENLDVSEWNNWSGHYEPEGSDALKEIGRKGLEMNGFEFTANARWDAWC